MSWKEHLGDIVIRMAAALVIGSSHVNKLKNYVWKRPNISCFNLKDKYSDILCHGISGGKLSNRKDTAEMCSMVEDYKPTVVVIHVAGNDLDQKGADQELCDELVLRLSLLAQHLRQTFRVKIVHVFELLPRTKPRYLDPEEYNSLKRYFNRQLKRELVGVHGVFFGKIKGVKESNKKIFYDGCHLTEDEGMVRYYRSIRGALLQCRTLENTKI